ncbi:hypothetical protein WDW89_07525 [Deltaproteobacteria bacterium TL4]
MEYLFDSIKKLFQKIKRRPRSSEGKQPPIAPDSVEPRVDLKRPETIQDSNTADKYSDYC